MARDFRTLIQSAIQSTHFGLVTLSLVILSTDMVGVDRLSAQETTKPKSETKAPADKSAEAPLDDAVNVEALLDARLPSEELDLGWIRLFDGQSLLGWKSTSDADWKVENDHIVVTKGQPGFLQTEVRFSDYEIELEFQADEKTNSGLFLRTSDDVKDPSKDCYEINIAPTDNPFPTGSIVGRSKVSEQVTAPESDQWHSLHALVDQDHIQVWVNGQQAADYKDTTGLVAGKIGLQFREGAIRFRNIRLRPIGYSVLPKADKSDWNEPAGAIEATFTDKGTIKLKGGRGHIELLQPHANLCLQATALTLTENVNSGIFFRCIPGEDMNGYECQIHHGFKEDRRRAVDAGSGSIFRRQNAKAVLSDEGKPVHITIIADGTTMATWVEGIPVVTWTDTRAPNDNPRKGLRTEAGTIMLQGHDPGSEVEFTALSICPLP
ncbi:MAG: DUF1080 domain-containing protein [Planctomycetota bacterium]|jgi:hypothetical protein